MTRTYQVEYKPSEDKFNPFVKIIEHKLRPCLQELDHRDRYRRSLSALLNSKPVPGHLDKRHSSLRTLYKYEEQLKG